MSDIRKFVKERNRAVFSFDIVKFKKYMRKWFPQKHEELCKHDDMFIKGVMAKMAMNITTAPSQVLVQAMIILAQLGWDEEIM